MKLKFFDFCSGVGSARAAFDKLNIKCVGYSEIDIKAEQTYNLLFGNNIINYGDIMKIDYNLLPEFDILVAGFPCQGFSIVGNQNGFSHISGNIIFGIFNILKNINPKVFLLENVTGLMSNNNGKTFNFILSKLKSLGYCVFYEVLNSYNFGIPHIRQRVYIVGFHKSLQGFERFKFPNSLDNNKEISEFLVDEYAEELSLQNATFIRYLNNKYNLNKYNMNKILQNDYTIIDWRQSDLRIYYSKIPTLRHARHGILYTKNNKLYKLSAREALLLQGFDDYYFEKLKQSKLTNNILLSQIGNSMTVTVIYEIAKSIKNVLMS